ncbi:MAG: hypothetical protein CVU39_21180 [Chloroflexi bacterium HGW-Chloroflexi-10]|nr:MAG: hypothetical protein CVU39_21180 [Chloroflexi bacterium HGW-Chloroflexi-10]
MLRFLHYHTNFTALSIDIDDFKNINDRHGHLTGDQVLITFSRICQEEIRQTDIFARIGGDEFSILLPETSLENTSVFANRLLNRINNTTVSHKGEKIHFQISVGIAAWKPEMADAQDLLVAIDEALYLAKSKGKNQVG